MFFAQFPTAPVHAGYFYFARIRSIVEEDPFSSFFRLSLFLLRLFHFEVLIDVCSMRLKSCTGAILSEVNGYEVIPVGNGVLTENVRWRENKKKT